VELVKEDEAGQHEDSGFRTREYWDVSFTATQKDGKSDYEDDSKNIGVNR